MASEIIRQGAAPIRGRPAPGPMPTPPAQPPADEPRGAADTAARADFAERLAGLRLAKGDQATRIDLLRQLGGEMTPEQLRAAADRIAGFGIGESQAQAAGWRRLIADMRSAAA